MRGVEADGPLSGIRVIDLTSIVMGPLATQLLADLGADVIKVEPPEGDVLRRVGAPSGSDMGPMFLHLNRNKRSMVLDLKTDAGKAALRSLVVGADVLAHSMRPAAMARLGFAYADLQPLNPRLVHVGMFGFGQSGPYAEDAAFDDLVQAMSGLADLMGRTGDGRPRYVPCNLADRTVGMCAFGAICAALLARARTGQGCEVGVPMFETLATLVLGDHMFGQTYVPPVGPMGYLRLLVRDRGPFPTRDGHVCAMIYTDAQWRAFLGAVGLETDLAADPRLEDIGRRTRHAEALFGFISDQTRRHDTAALLALLREAGLPAVAMRRIEDLPEDPHLTASGFFEPLDHPAEGQIRLMRPPIEIGGWYPVTRYPPPRLGAHTADLLAEISAASPDHPGSSP